MGFNSLYSLVAHHSQIHKYVELFSHVAPQILDIHITIQDIDKIVTLDNLTDLPTDIDLVMYALKYIAQLWFDDIIQPTVDLFSIVLPQCCYMSDLFLEVSKYVHLIE
jgi:hypothetical protein